MTGAATGNAGGVAGGGAAILGFGTVAALSTEGIFSVGVAIVGAGGPSTPLALASLNAAISAIFSRLNSELLILKSIRSCHVIIVPRQHRAGVRMASGM